MCCALVVDEEEEEGGGGGSVMMGWRERLVGYRYSQLYAIRGWSGEAELGKDLVMWGFVPGERRE